MSKFGLLVTRLIPRTPVGSLCTIKPLIFDSIPVAPSIISIRGLKVKKDAKPAAGKKGAAMVKPKLDVEEDAHKLVNYVCGLNYRIDGVQEPVKIRPDSEYPDWLWTIPVERPLPPLEEQDPNTKGYWMLVQRNMKRQRNRLMKVYQRK